VAFAPTLASLRLAVSFLTVVPVRSDPDGAAALGTAAGWFPAIGGLLGAVAGGVDYVLAPSLGPPVAAIVAVGVLVVLTGALHLDGLADCADGLGGRSDRERRLAIMRDSSVGTFGALGLILWLLLFAAALAALGRGDALRGLVVAAGLGRWAALVHARTSTPARPDGLGAGFRVADGALVLASCTAVVLAGGLLGPVDGLVGLAVALVVGLSVSAWSGRALGGLTGDTLGASVALAEVAVILTLLAVGLH
jgi:adenosylcobinamide-GDP ribazoletransferase